jgi:Flp pilus assembly protein TadD
MRDSPAWLLIWAAVFAACTSFEAGRLYRSGTEALDHDDPARAVADLERAAALAPEASSVHNHLGIAYEEAGRPEDALRAYERAVDLDCENQAAQHNLEVLRARRSGKP